MCNVITRVRNSFVLIVRARYPFSLGGPGRSLRTVLRSHPRGASTLQGCLLSFAAVIVDTLHPVKGRFLAAFSTGFRFGQVFSVPCPFEKRVFNLRAFTAFYIGSRQPRKTKRLRTRDYVDVNAVGGRLKILLEVPRQEQMGEKAFHVL